MKTLFILFFVLLSNLAFSVEHIDEIKVYKEKHRMEAYYQGKLVKTYVVMLGRGGMDRKLQEGDNLVPEGHYILDEKNPDSKYFKSIHISYPNDEDLQRSADAGVNPGGEVFIHGLPNTSSKKIEWLREKLVKVKNIKQFKFLQKKLDWTRGCIAVSDKESEEIFNAIVLPAPITIYK